MKYVGYIRKTNTNTNTDIRPRLNALPGTWGQQERQQSHFVLHKLMGTKPDRQCFNGIADPVFIHDADYRLVLVNDAYCQVAGVTDSEALGKHYWEVFPPGTGPLPECEGVVDGDSHRPVHDEIKVGSKRFLSNSYHYHDSASSTPQFLHILIDITDSEVIDTALRETKELLQTIINAVPVRIFWKDRELRYLGANTLFANDAGYKSGDELICKNDMDMPW